MKQQPGRKTCPAQQPDEQKIVKIHTRMRRTRRARLMWGRVALLLFIMAAIASAFMLNTEVFKINIIEITGTARVSKNEVARLAGIRHGSNIILLGARSVREALLQNPLIKDVEIKRNLPDKVMVTVFERKPFAYVHIGARFYMIDDEQVVIEISKAPNNKDLKIISSDGAMPAEIGRSIEFPRKELVAGFFKIAEKTIAGQYKRAMFNRSGITIILSNGAYVQLGEGEQLEEKLKYVPMLVQSLDRSGQQYKGINLKNLTTPTFVKKATGAEQASTGSAN